MWFNIIKRRLTWAEKTQVYDALLGEESLSATEIADKINLDRNMRNAISSFLKKAASVPMVRKHFPGIVVVPSSRFETKPKGRSMGRGWERRELETGATGLPNRTTRRLTKRYKRIVE